NPAEETPAACYLPQNHILISQLHVIITKKSLLNSPAISLSLAGLGFFLDAYEERYWMRNVECCGRRAGHPKCVVERFASSSGGSQYSIITTDFLRRQHLGSLSHQLVLWLRALIDRRNQMAVSKPPNPLTSLTHHRRHHQ